MDLKKRATWEQASTDMKAKQEASAKWVEMKRAHPPIDWNTQQHA